MDMQLELPKAGHFADRLKYLRASRGLEIAECARRCRLHGVTTTPRKWRNYEEGQVGSPNLVGCVPIFKALDLTEREVYWLAAGEVRR